MAAPYGRFSGKIAFGSTGGKALSYLTTTSSDDGESVLYLPAMTAASATASERCILYDQGNGRVRIQMAGLLWIGLDLHLKWLVLVDDFARAVDVVLGGEPWGQSWKVWTGSDWAPVYYLPDSLTANLTIMGGKSASSQFAPTVITPSLDEIGKSKSGRGGDFQHVDLTGEQLAGIDFTGSDFRQSVLAGVSFAGSTLAQCTFRGTNMTGVACDGAVLDEADLTQAILSNASWGKLASAKKLNLTQCSAAGALLGSASNALDCTGANLSLADLRGADLRNLVLTNCQAGGALLAGAKLDNAKLDNGNLQSAVLNDASLTGASLVEVKGQGASFVRADLSSADLTRAQMGANSYCFTLAGSFASELDTYAYPQPDLIQAFAASGFELKAQDPIEVVAAGSHWKIEDDAGPYDLLKNETGGIDVSRASSDLSPAVFRDAICQATIGKSASFPGADLRGVQWHGAEATLDHADLQGAALSGALLESIDLTQAFLDGADLSESVLVQARLAGCRVGAGDNGRMLSLEGALLMGADFSDATLLGALLVDAAVALPHGVPLFDLPASAAEDLDNGNVAALSPLFEQAGYPLGSNPSVKKYPSWLLDNEGDPNTAAPRSYWVQESSNKLKVYDGTTMKYLFALPSSDAVLLEGPTAPPELVDAFAQTGTEYSLAPDAPITPQPYWEVNAGSDAPFDGTYAFPTMRIFPDGAELLVSGSATVKLRDWDQLSAGLAFGPTQALETALNPACLGPSGAPCSWVEQGLITWQSLMTVKR